MRWFNLLLLCLSILLVFVSRVHGFTTITTAATGRTIRKSSEIPAWKIPVPSLVTIPPHAHKRFVIQRRQNQQQKVSTLLTSTANDTMDGSSSSANEQSPRKHNNNDNKNISNLSATLSKLGMMAFIGSMCLALPIVLFPPFLLYKLKLISQVRQQQMALSAGQFCARWLLRLIPFCTVQCYSSPDEETDPQPCVWACNHTSALDIFILLAKDKQLRGKRKRPIKIVYWKGLEDNPITKLLFTQCGFIPVQMAANSAGDDNDYDLKSFKTLLRMSKQAFKEGFDIGILPEGQLNPHPEEKLLPCFPGAFTLAKLSRRPIRFMALHGTHRLWHARDDIGMTVTGRDIALRVYPGQGRKLSSAAEFLATFEAVVGKFATTGKDLDDDELHAWIDGSKWETDKKNEISRRTTEEDDDENKK